MRDVLIGIAGGISYSLAIGALIWKAHRDAKPTEIPVRHLAEDEEGDLKMITKNSVRDIYRHLQSAAEKMPSDCLITVQIQSHNITHRFSVQNSELGHIESHDSESVTRLDDQDQAKLKMFRTKDIMRYAD